MLTKEIEQSKITIYICEADNYSQLLNSIIIYGNMNKGQLINCIYNGSGNKDSKRLLRKLSFGTLLMMVIEEIYGG